MISRPIRARAGGVPGEERTARRPAAPLGRRLLVLGAAAAVLCAALLGYGAFRATLYPVMGLERSAPRRTALMLQREAEARANHHAYRIDQRCVSYGRISPLLRRAVLIAEDDAFFQHGGLDWNEIRASARADLERRRVVRGGSTITQQLAKNLFLGDRRSVTRKVTEAFLAIRLERALDKRRIFELYLNLIEWGDGIFGVEATAQRYFRVSASDLSERQAVLLAAVIINPRRYSVLAPSRRIERRVRLIAERMRRRGYLGELGFAVATGTPPPPSLADSMGLPSAETTSVETAAGAAKVDTPAAVRVDSTGLARSR